MRNDLVLVVLLISILALMVIPLPSGLIDVLLTVNISLSVMLLMVAVYLKRPSDFSTFPSVILIATAFRLSLSIATTRLILSEADAGKIIETFGEFVIRGSIVIGLVIFLIITVVQFVVVTKGAERVAEVAARFTLDAMPGKQMSIEADIRAGTLEQAEGARMRKALDKDSQFFGAMDGAMKFVKGDAIAGLIIIFINLLGGIAVGTSVHGLSLGEAASIYSLLTIGDGLVAQIPALLMSLCAGAIVTRVANVNAKDLGSDIARELMSDARVPAAAAAVIFCFGLVPGFPFFVFAAASLGLFTASLFVRAALRKTAADAQDAASTESAEAASDAAAHRTNDRIGLCLSTAASEHLNLDEIRREVGDRVDLYSARYGVNFARPFIVTRDISPGESRFQIELDEVAIDAGALQDGHLMTNATQDQLRAMNIETTHPVVDWIVSATPRRLVPQKCADALHKAGLEATTIETALAECLFRRLENNVRILFSRTEADEVIESARQQDATTVGYVTEKQSSQNLVRIFRYLLEDGVPLRPRRLLVESLAHWIHLHPDADAVFLAECLRNSLKRQLCQNLANDQGELGVSMLFPSLQERIVNDVKHIRTLEEGAEIDSLPIEPALSDYLIAEVRKLIDLDVAPGRRIAIVAAPEIRRRLRNFLAHCGINVPVISPHEISQDIITVPVDVLGENFKGTTTSSASREQRLRSLERRQPKRSVGPVPA